MLTGPTGTGKTFAQHQVVQNIDSFLVTIEGKEGLTNLDFIGAILLQEDGSRRWIDGPLLRAMRQAKLEPILLFLDEVNRISLDPAVRRRFDTVIEFDYLEYRDELALVRREAPDLSTRAAEALVKLAQETRCLLSNGEMPGCVDTVSLLNWAMTPTASKWIGDVPLS